MAINIKEFATKTTEEIRDDYLRIGEERPDGSASTRSVRGATTFSALRRSRTVSRRRCEHADQGGRADADTATGAGPRGGFETRFRSGASPGGPGGGWIVLTPWRPLPSPSAWLHRRSEPALRRADAGSYDAGDLRSHPRRQRRGGNDHEAGYTLRWVAPPPHCNTKQVVATGGLTGGAEAEDEETARQRLIDDIQNRRGTVTGRRRSSTLKRRRRSSRRALRIPAANGPSTQHIAVVGYASSVSKSRAVDAVVMCRVRRSVRPSARCGVRRKP